MVSKRTHTLTREEILSAALSIVDTEGLDALSMRRLARDLGVEAMTLYHHFPNKEAILDGVGELVIADMALAEPLPEDWMELLVEMCVAFRRALGSHPNAIPILMSRPLNPPSGAAVTPASVLTSAGFDPDQMVEMYQALMALTFGHAIVSNVTPAAGVSPDAPFPPAVSDDAAFKRAVRILIAGYAAETRTSEAEISPGAQGTD